MAQFFTDAMAVLGCFTLSVIMTELLKLAFYFTCKGEEEMRK